MASSPASRRTRAGLSVGVAAAAVAATVLVAPSASAAKPIGQPVVGGDTAVYGAGCRYPVGILVDPRTSTTTAPADARPADARPADARPADARPADARPADGRVPVDKPVTKKPKADKKKSDPKTNQAAPKKPGGKKKKVSKYVYFWDVPAGAKPWSRSATVIGWAEPTAKGVAVVNWAPKTSGFRDVYARYHKRWSKPTQVTVEDAISVGRLCLLRFW